MSSNGSGLSWPPTKLMMAPYFAASSDNRNFTAP